MARITLDPGESFGHRHDHATETTLLGGSALLFLDGEVRGELTLNEVLEVGPNVEHEFVAGPNGAVMYCGRCGR